MKTRKRKQLGQYIATQRELLRSWTIHLTKPLHLSVVSYGTPPFARREAKNAYVLPPFPPRTVYH